MTNTDTCLPIFKNEKPSSHGVLVDKFTIPPFSIFDTRQGYWIDRKREWLSLGIESEIGRKEELTYRKLDETKYKSVKSTNEKSTSVFDPVLCEVLVKWFTRPGARILDPFAGGSVRGIVSAALGRRYFGIELRGEQCSANRSQARRVDPSIFTEQTGPSWTEGDAALRLSGMRGNFDFLFSCPPYADLEVYSDHPRDLSNMPYDEFLESYREIIEMSCGLLNDNRFACFVVSEVRNKKTGIYRGFVSDTIRAFEAAGLGLYNDVVMLNHVGTGAIRANSSMNTRKVVRLHQNVLVFVKGDPKKAANWARELSD